MKTNTNNKQNNFYKNAAIFVGGAVLGASILTAIHYKPKPIIAEGFPKGYVIEKADIPTRGDITRVTKLPNEQYKDTVINGQLCFIGNFEYEITPMFSAAPKDAFHTDKQGHTLTNTNYQEATRQGIVRGYIRSIDDKLVK